MSKQHESGGLGKTESEHGRNRARHVVQKEGLEEDHIDIDKRLTGWIPVRSVKK